MNKKYIIKTEPPIFPPKKYKFKTKDFYKMYRYIKYWILEEIDQFTCTGKTDNYRMLFIHLISPTGNLTISPGFMTPKYGHLVLVYDPQ